MTRSSTIKATLVFAGAALFGLGIRSGTAALRWGGIACIAAALVLRWTPFGRRGE